MRHAISGAVSLFLLTLLTLGCANTDKNDVSGSTFDATGVMRPAPGTGTPPPGGDSSVDGTWRTERTVTFSSCGARVPSQDGAVVEDLAQSGGILIAHLFDGCGNQIARGDGTVDGASIFVNFTEEIRQSQSCTLRIQTIQSGTLQAGGQPLISGNSRSTVSALGNCGSGLPCEIKANLLMERCPPASCSSSSCP